jgi:HAE1 family hydrophobic/amphiphilic exporter-1
LQPVAGVFNLDVDTKSAAGRRDRVALVGARLPEGIAKPQVTPFNANDQPILSLVVFSKSSSPSGMQHWRIASLPSGSNKQILVLVDLDRLQAYA